MTAPGGAPASPSPSRARGSGSRCQICEVDLTGERIFFRRYRACPQHVHADAINLDGKPHRFCQQCGRFHRLDAFDGDKRSCREQLAQHAARRRYLYRLRHSGGGGSGGRTGGGRTGRSAGGRTPSGSDSDGAVGGGSVDPSDAALLSYLSRPTPDRGTPPADRTTPQLGGLAGGPPPPPMPLPLPQPQHRAPSGELTALPTLTPPLDQAGLDWQAVAAVQHQQAAAAQQQQQAAQELSFRVQPAAALEPQMPFCSQQAAPGWQRTDSGKSSQQAPAGFAWQRTDSGKSSQQAPGWQRTDSGKSGRAGGADSGLSGLSSGHHLSGFLNAVAMAAVNELGTPCSDAPTPAASPPGALAEPAAEAAAAAVAELSGWVDAQLARQRERSLLSLLGAPAEPPRGSAFAPLPAAPAECGGRGAAPPPPPVDAQEVWAQLWAAVPPPPPPTAAQLASAAASAARGERLVWRPLARRVGVLAPALRDAVTAGRLPLNVAAAQAQPLAALMAQLQKAAGPLQPHELVRLLEQLQPPPALVAVPAPAPPPEAPPPPQPTDQLMGLLAQFAPRALQ